MLRVGDKVVFKENLVDTMRYEGILYFDEMKDQLNGPITIVEVIPLEDGYVYKGIETETETGIWYLTEPMLELHKEMGEN